MRSLGDFGLIRRAVINAAGMLSDAQRTHRAMEHALRAGDLEAVRQTLGHAADFPNVRDRSPTRTCSHWPSTGVAAIGASTEDDQFDPLNRRERPSR
jgi:hypothetical protein